MKRCILSSLLQIFNNSAIPYALMFYWYVSSERNAPSIAFWENMRRVVSALMHKASEMLVILAAQIILTFDYMHDVLQHQCCLNNAKRHPPHFLCLFWKEKVKEKRKWSLLNKRHLFLCFNAWISNNTLHRAIQNSPSRSPWLQRRIKSLLQDLVIGIIK